MRTITLTQMEKIEGGGLKKIVQVGCALYGVYGVGALIFGGTVGIGAGIFCAGVGLASILP